MQLLPVKSSQVSAIGYDPGTLKLRVKFKPFNASLPPPTYEYSNVSQTDYAGIIGAESIGKAINKTLKANPAKYPFVKITEPESAQ